MNRTIKFRAWNKIDNRWVNSSEHLNETEVGATVNPPSILTISHPDWVFMQYIGFHDKNGVEIYEGDIDQDGGIFTWVQDNCSFCIDYKGIELASIEGSNPAEWCEIKGNFYENPELIPA